MTTATSDKYNVSPSPRNTSRFLSPVMSMSDSLLRQWIHQHPERNIVTVHRSMSNSETELADKKPNSSFTQKILHQPMHEVHSTPSSTQLIKIFQNFYKTRDITTFPATADDKTYPAPKAHPRPQHLNAAHATLFSIFTSLPSDFFPLSCLE